MSADLPRILLSSSVLQLTHGAILQFFAPRERHVSPIVAKFGKAEENNNLLRRAKFQVDQSIYGISDPKKFKNPKFCKLIRPVGTNLSIDFMKFINFIRL